MKRRHLMLLLPAGLLISSFVNAGGPAGQSADDYIQLNDLLVSVDIQADEAMTLKEKGSIMALRDLITQVNRDFPGRIIEVELEDDDGRYIYEMELVNEEGVVIELEIDATNGKVIKYEQEDD